MDEKLTLFAEYDNNFKEKFDTISGEFQHDTDMGMFDLAWELEDELSDVIEKFGGILKVKSDLTDLSPPLVDNQDEDMVG